MSVKRKSEKIEKYEKRMYFCIYLLGNGGSIR